METSDGRPKGSARILDVLDAFVDLAGPVALRDLAEHLELPKSSVHRLLAILKDAGYVAQDPLTERYELGTQAFRLGATALRSHSLAQVAHPFLRALVEKTGESVHLATRDQDRTLIVDRLESDLQIIRAVSPVGARTPLHATGAGKALLAWLSEDERGALIARLPLERRTPRTITEPAALERELAATRARGYAIDDEESLLGVRCVAVPIRDVRGRPVASISITAPKQRVPRERLTELASLAKETAEEISLRYGGR